MPQLDDYTVTITREMSWGQMDAFQHMNNIEYFRYFEDARIQYFERADLIDRSSGGGFDRVGPILASTSCQFKAPLAYPATIVAGARVIELEDDRFKLEHAVADRASDHIAAVGEALIVTFDYSEGHKVEVPDKWLDEIRRLEGSI